MVYATSRSFNGDIDKALDTVETVLLANGFTLRERAERLVVFTGRGLRSTKENPVRGATRIAVRARGGRLDLEADLGGVRSMVLFLCIFPVALLLALATILALTTTGSFGAALARTTPALAVWVLISPMMSVWTRRRATQALDDLLASAAVRGRS